MPVPPDRVECRSVIKDAAAANLDSHGCDKSCYKLCSAAFRERLAEALVYATHAAVVVTVADAGN